jgi:DUF971 family protein
MSERSLAHTLTAFTELDDGKIEIRWADGAVTTHPTSWVRFKCGCAHCVDEWSGRQVLQPNQIPADIHPTSAEPVGNYAVRIAWSDGHDTGYYPLENLRSMPPAPDDWAAYLRGERQWPTEHEIETN